MSIETAYRRLGYTPQWISLGIITKDYLLGQLEEINNSEDQNAEHYRCGGFRNYLDSKSKLSDFEIEAIFTLKDNGPDNCDLHHNRVIELIHSEILTDEQIEFIAKYPEVLFAPIQKRYLRSKLIRKIKAEGITVCFEEVKDTKDSAIHECVLEHGELTFEQVAWLSSSGLNKRTRNIAKQLLNSKKYAKRLNNHSKGDRKKRGAFCGR